MTRALIRPVTLAGILALAGACTMKSQDPPPFSGPSELDLSILVSVSPDQLQQDGASQSVVTVTARDTASQPVRNLSLQARIAVQGTPVDFGSLSARSVVTNGDGKATFVYTAPPAPAIASDDFTVVDILVTPQGNDFNNSRTRSAAIRLYPPGVVRPPINLQPAFTVTPSNAEANQTILFDASTSQGSIVAYNWNFGDGDRATGRTVSHEFDTVGTFIVTLTVVDGFGASASTSQSVSVGAGQNPTAAFVTSPANPFPAQDLFFNASASRAAPGRTIVSYQWDFGDGTSGSGVQTSHRYANATTYSVTLIVTDDAGRTATVTQAVAIGNDSPTAAFDFAPSAPTAGSAVAFNGSASTAVAGRTIVSYIWNFGDGFTGSGVAVSHTYATPGTRNVTLTVVDSQGKSGSITKPITVQ
jgi:PKD repeat protein